MEEVCRINGGKGAKDHVVALYQAVARFLESYILAIHLKLLEKRASDRLLRSLRGVPIARNTLGEVVTKYARRGRIKKHLTCHLCWHSCATHL